MASNAPSLPTRVRRAVTSPAATAQCPPPPTPSALSPPQAHRSISFHVRSRDMSEGHRMRWDADAEARLQAAEIELERAQKSWSERQELWLEEVEALRGMKKESERFYRRREKLMKAEGMKWWKAVGRNKDSASIISEEIAEWSGVEDEFEEETGTGTGSRSPTGKGLGIGFGLGDTLLQRITSFPGTGQSSPRINSTSQSSSRKSSMVGNLMRGVRFKRRDSV